MNTPGKLREHVIAALRRVYDPEMPVNVYDLGLIYDVQAGEDGFVAVRMTLTAPNCPVAGSLPAAVESKVRTVEGVTGAKVELVFDPPWDKSRMSDAARLELGMEDIVPIGKLR